MTSNQEFDYIFTGRSNYHTPREQRKDNDGRYYDPYIPSIELIEAVNLAIDLGRPLLLEGEPGCGKTRLASAIVYELTQKNLRKNKRAKQTEWWPFYDWRVKSYTRARDGLYTFDAIGRLRDTQMAGTNLKETLTPTQIEVLDWVEKGRGFTCRYEDYIYAQVKTLTVEQVSKQENLGRDQVQGIFSRIAARELAKKTGATQNESA